MGGFSDAFENLVLDHVFKNTALAQPTNLYVGLATSTIDDADTGSTIPSEITGGGYLRKQCNTWAAAAAGSLDNGIAVAFAEATASYGTVNDFFVADHSSTGDVVVFGKLTTSKTVGSGDTGKFATGDLKVTLD